MTLPKSGLFDVGQLRRWALRWTAATLIVPSAVAAEPSSLRFVAAPPTASDAPSAVAPRASAPATLKFVPASPSAVAPVPTSLSGSPSAVEESAWELKFAPLPAAPTSVSTLPACPLSPTVGSPAATELFSASNPWPVGDSSAALPAKQVLAPAPRAFESQAVQSARDITPIEMPAGSELFVAAPPRTWDLPALDYGAALQRVEPSASRKVVATVKSIAPTHVVARELPPGAADLFTLAPRQPSLPPQDLAATPSTPPTVAQIKSQPLPARGAAQIEPTPQPAAELDVSQVAAARPEPAAKPQFVAISPNLPAAAEPRATVAPRLVPASVKDVKTSLAVPVAEVQPSELAPPTSAPAREQVAVTAEPNDPNTYRFHFTAARGEQSAATFASTTEPVPAAEPGPTAVDPPAPLTEAMPTPGCNCQADAYGQCGCPYLPGQSGTRTLCGVDCGRCGSSCCSTWSDAQCIPWALFGPGEYVGPARPAHVETYFLRVNDLLTLTFIESRKKSAEHYRIGVGDQLQIEWLQGAGNTEVPLNRKLLVQPDGTVTLPLIGEVLASGKTLNDFRDEVVKLYSKYQRDPQITVTPLTVNVAVQDVLKAVTSKNASSGQTQDVRVTPEGTIQAAGIGSVYVQGLTLDELKSELEARYTEAYGPGLAVSPQLTERATSYVFMGGEVRAPGRYTLEGPTTVMQAVEMAGGWNNGGNLRQVVVFRRDENWCLKATKIDIRAPLYGKDPCPTNDVWLRENDLVIVPKSCILCATDLIELYFTRGVYAVFPINYVYDFSKNSSIVPIGP